SALFSHTILFPGCPVVDGELVASVKQVVRHRLSHVSDTDECDFRRDTPQKLMMPGVASLIPEFPAPCEKSRHLYEKTRRRGNRDGTIDGLSDLRMTTRTATRILCLLPALLLTRESFGADLTGVRPRVDRTQYAVAMFNQTLAVAVELVPADN